MRKYADILYGFFKASAISDLEYRANIIVKVITDVIWYTAQLTVFGVLYSNVGHVGGWTMDTTRVFIAVFFVTDSIWMLLFSENLDKLAQRVRKGELDLLLTKPVNSQFMMSFQRISTPYLVNFFLTIGFLFYAFVHAFPNGPTATDWARLPLLFILIPTGLGITYGIRFMFSSASLIFTRAENLNNVWYTIHRLAFRPDAFYPPWLRFLVLTFVPVAFIASVPARLVLGSSDWYLLPAAIALAVISVYLSTRFWKYAMRFYSSASS